MRIMIFIAVLFVCLWNDPAGFLLNFPFLKHEGMLRARPVLDRGEAKPIRSAILRLAMGGMTGSQMFVGVPTDEESSSLMSPFFIAERVEIIAQVPGDI